jgi:hypothetical protein
MQKRAAGTALALNSRSKTMDAIVPVLQCDPVKKVAHHLGEDDKIGLALHEIASMLEFAHREIENWTAEDGIFHVSYDNINLVDFAICDLDRRVKDLRQIWDNG